jgi:glycerophosphoryl diester phosphodiesterase
VGTSRLWGFRVSIRIKQFWRAVAVLATALVAVGFGTAPADAAPARTAATWTAPTWAPPEVTAHRGGSDERPENTMDAFRNAVAVGADMVEFDVRSTSDHRLVVLHDRTLNRTTNCTGAVYTRTLAQVRTCRTDGNRQRVPMLVEVLNYLEPLGVAITPEIKDYGTDMDNNEVARLVARVKSRQMTARTFVQSFNPRVFALVNRAAPALTTVYLANAVIRVTALKTYGADIASVNMTALSRSNVNSYHAQGRQIWTWTADTDAELQKAWTLGADSVGTDIPTRALALYGR